MPEMTELERGKPGYPAALESHLGDEAPGVVRAYGRWTILQQPSVALFCSRNCPGDLASLAYDVAQYLRDTGTTVMGGFHSPMERECLKILLASPHPVVIGLGRTLSGPRLPAPYQRPLAENRLLVLSCFGRGIHRVTVETSRIRNLFVAALAEQVFVTHAEAGSGTERFCRTVLGWGKPLYTLFSRRNEGIISLGAQALRPDEVRDVFAIPGLET